MYQLLNNVFLVFWFFTLILENYIFELDTSSGRKKQGISSMKLLIEVDDIELILPNFLVFP